MAAPLRRDCAIFSCLPDSRAAKGIETAAEIDDLVAYLAGLRGNQ